MPIQPKIHALKVSYFAPHCANEYEKEKEEEEKNMTTKYHEPGVANNYEQLFNNILVYKSLKADF